MPSSRNSFSIRKLLVAPRRRSTAACVGVGAVDANDYSKRNKSSPGSSDSSSSSTIVGPAQASRSQSSLANDSPDEEEMSRVKAAVAAAASAAACNLRKRDGDYPLYAPNANTSDPGIASTPNSITADEASSAASSPAKPIISTIDPARIQAAQPKGKAAEKLRKKNRPSLQPIVVSRPSSSGPGSQAQPPTSQHQLKRQTIQTVQTIPTPRTASTVQTTPHTGDTLKTASTVQTLPDTPPSSSLLSPATSLCACEGQAQPGTLPQPVTSGNRQDCLCSSNDTAAFSGQKQQPAAAPPTPNPNPDRPPSLPPPCTSHLPAPSTNTTTTSTPIPGLVTPPLPHPRYSCSSAHSYTRPRPEHIRAFRKSAPAPKKQRRQSDGKKDSGVELSDDEPTNNTDLSQQAPTIQLDFLEALTLEPDNLESSLPPRTSGEAPETQPQPQAGNPAEDDTGSQAMQTHASGIGSISLPLQIHNFSSSASNENIAASAGSSAVEGETHLDSGCSPTFTQPRRAPSPLDVPQRSSARSSFAITPPHTPQAPSTTFDLPTHESVPNSVPKKQPKFSRFRPTSLARKPSNASSRVQRKRSKKSRRRDRSLSKATSLISVPQATARPTSHRNSKGASGSRWTLPDNLVELFSGSLFSRMEVDEMLSPEQLQAIRENRSASQQKRIAMSKESMEMLSPEQIHALLKASKSVRSKKQVESKPETSTVSEGGETTPDTQQQQQQQQQQPPLTAPSESSPESAPVGDTDGGETPIEPFHLQDLPSRIGAAGVRLSVLLPVEEEAACFAASARKRSGSTGDASDADERPSLPQKNPLRYTRNSGNMPSIPEVLVTDVDGNANNSVSNIDNGANGKGPEETVPEPAPVSGIEQLLPPAEVRESDTENVYFAASAYSMVMPTYRHGPIRIAKPEPPEDRAPQLAADDTLDWTAFQMAILGGAGDFFSDSVDYGRSSADADELDDLVRWFHSTGVPVGRLLGDDNQKVAKKSQPSSIYRQSGEYSSESDTPRGPRAYTSHVLSEPTGSFWNNAMQINDQQRFQDAQDAGLRRWTFDAPPQRYSGGNSPYRHRSAQSSTSSVYSREGIGSEGNSSTSTLPPLSITEMPTTRTPPPIDTNRLQAPRKSCASFDSFESMPQSPMQDLMMSRGSDGVEYVVPMGYNLSHDLGDFLRWENENACGGEF